jgi:hypothetical protein
MVPPPPPRMSPQGLRCRLIVWCGLFVVGAGDVWVLQDALWALGRLECSNAGQVFLLLKASDLIQYDLQHVFRECVDGAHACSPEDGPSSQPHLVCVRACVCARVCSCAR